MDSDYDINGSNMANPVGAPPKLTDDEKQEVYDAFTEYINTTDDPTTVGFVSVNEVALQYSVTRHNIHDWAEFSALEERAVTKQEHFLITNAGSNKYNPTFAIFRLKQPVHGWKDRIENDLTTAGQPFNFQVNRGNPDS